MPSDVARESIVIGASSTDVMAETGVRNRRENSVRHLLVRHHPP